MDEERKEASTNVQWLSKILHNIEVEKLSERNRGFVKEIMDEVNTFNIYISMEIFHTQT